MLPKSGTRLPERSTPLSDAALAAQIANALQHQLGGSRRATKTIMTWTGVSDHTARSWLAGKSSPSSAHMLVLAARSTPVMATVLRLTGRDSSAIDIDLEAAETALAVALASVRAARSGG